MYKLILGNTRITVHDDCIRRSDASACARQALRDARAAGKQLSHIDISLTDSGLAAEVTTKSASAVVRKTLHQSIRDSLVKTLESSFFPDSTFQDSRYWQDSDTGQEWSGELVLAAKEDVLEEVRTWLTTRTDTAHS